ncbi:MAG: HEAT repeat domain-containing protein [Deltaproteobacteria bacterium]|nr:HEAT repeat domain-containing protein [Deltaproteobacteria bacterium]MBN2846647.1 HEAT repeat domain-containing protein [Deltaproteobacteria bacterium]
MKAVKPEPTREEIEAAKKAVAELLFLRKTFSLYPEDHSICVNAFDQFQRQIGKFLQTYRSLRFELQKNRLLFHGEVIHIEEFEEGTFSYTLFRDGIRWVELNEGISSAEIKEFLRILNAYETLPEEPEGDLVTAFWEAELPHINYDVADMSWGAESEMNFTPSHNSEGVSSNPSFLEEEGLDIVTDVTISRELLEISPEEEKKLQELVRIEEKRDPTSDYLNALFDSLLEDTSKENFESVLDTLEEELREFLAVRNFDRALGILESLKYILEQSPLDLPWTTEALEDFFLAVSNPQSLIPLQSAWTEATPDEMEKIRDILLLLRPEAIHTLGPILLQTPSLRMQQTLTDAMTKMASKDIRPLESLLEGTSEEELIQRIVQILGNLEGRRPIKLLKKMAGHHSVKVRLEASKGLLKRDPEGIKKLFHLIDEDNESLHSLILDHLAAARNSVAEELLIDYLEKGNHRRTDDNHILACYRALGKCGSLRSLPFLRRVLFRQGWMPRFWKAARRRGAAIALSTMGTDEARQVLEDASRSFYPSVRREAKRAMEKQGN